MDLSETLEECYSNQEEIKQNVDCQRRYADKIVYAIMVDVHNAKDMINFISLLRLTIKVELIQTIK